MVEAIRDARLEDSLAVAALEVAARRAAHTGLVPGNLLDELCIEDLEACFRAWLTTPPAGGRFWVLTEEDAIVGFVDAGPARDADARPDEAELYGLHVEPGSWGRGIGTALFRHAVAALAAAGVRALLVWVLDKNGRACRFCADRGMRRDGATREDEIGEQVRYRVDLPSP